MHLGEKIASKESGQYCHVMLRCKVLVIIPQIGICPCTGLDPNHYKAFKLKFLDVYQVVSLVLSEWPVLKFM